MLDPFPEERANMDRSDIRQRRVEEVDLMLTNARLRDELEPYRDESIDPSVSRMSLQDENEYLASMLAWEKAPALPIASWFSPVLELPSPDLLDDEELSSLLLVTVEKLYSARVILRYTDHLSDRDLYKIIYRDILPCCEKKVELPGKFLEWRCMEDTDVWLRFYADAIERRRFQEEFEVELPPSETPMHKRQLPGN
ncbi:hypothetical protein N9D23_02200 [Rubripirellula sp.]|nr:hypothetical protein [Rubripirellula sp.]MDF1841936.1 hypothetical protein [Rubripirellula sp.]